MASDSDLARMHRPRIAALLEAQPDLLAIETIPSFREIAVLTELLAAGPAWRRG